MSCTDLTICECGCGQEFLKFDMRNRVRRFINGHRNRSNKFVVCTHCGKMFHKKQFAIKKSKNNFCSRKCYWESLVGKESKRKTNIFKKCLFCKNEFRVIPANIKNGWGKYCSKNCQYKDRIGKYTRENSPRWIKDRSKLAKKQIRNDYAYQDWRKQVIERDGGCRINDINCTWKIEVHHILSWRDYPELRYNINNGITLCQAHHPLKRAEEKRLIPFFQGLVSVSK